jgi:hypothetical protein
VPPNELKVSWSGLEAENLSIGTDKDASQQGVKADICAQIVDDISPLDRRQKNSLH